jgi:hypothetical protein
MYVGTVNSTLDVFLTGLIPPLLPTYRVSCVARSNSGIPPIQGKLNCHGTNIELNQKEIKGGLLN